MIDGDVPPGQVTDEFATLFNQKVIDVWELRHLLKSQLVPLRVEKFFWAIPNPGVLFHVGIPTVFIGLQFQFFAALQQTFQLILIPKKFTN